LEAADALLIHAKVYPRTCASNGPGLFLGILAAAKVGEGYTFRTRLSAAGVRGLQNAARPKEPLKPDANRTISFT